MSTFRTLVACALAAWLTIGCGEDAAREKTYTPEGWPEVSCTGRDCADEAGNVWTWAPGVFQLDARSGMTFISKDDDGRLLLEAPDGVELPKVGSTVVAGPDNGGLIAVVTSAQWYDTGIIELITEPPSDIHQIVETAKASYAGELPLTTWVARGPDGEALPLVDEVKADSANPEDGVHIGSLTIAIPNGSGSQLKITNIIATLNPSYVWAYEDTRADDFDLELGASIAYNIKYKVELILSDSVLSGAAQKKLKGDKVLFSYSPPSFIWIGPWFFFDFEIGVRLHYEFDVAASASLHAQFNHSGDIGFSLTHSGGEWDGVGDGPDESSGERVSMTGQLAAKAIFSPQVFVRIEPYNVIRLDAGVGPFVQLEAAIRTTLLLSGAGALEWAVDFKAEAGGRFDLTIEDTFTKYFKADAEAAFQLNWQTDFLTYFMLCGSCQATLSGGEIDVACALKCTDQLCESNCPEATVCEPNCLGRVCGDDGCSGTCGDDGGACPQGDPWVCNPTLGTCSCIQRCDHILNWCGYDSCGLDLCECPLGWTCDDSAGVHRCELNCDNTCPEGFCGINDCGVLCHCDLGQEVCDLTLDTPTCAPICQPTCGGQCNFTESGCDALCGCDDGFECTETAPGNIGICVPDAESGCPDGYCGPIGQFGVCACDAGSTCNTTTTQCVSDDCEADCTGKVCGQSDGCFGTCTGCDQPAATCIGGQCICEQDCEGKVCGDDDGCGGTCAECPNPADLCIAGTCDYPCDVATCDPAFDECLPDGTCVQCDAAANCVGKVCGDDFCGGVCGAGCTAGQECTGGQCAGIPAGRSCQQRTGSPMCCGPRDDNCRSDDETCFCDEFCIEARDCCADACDACGFCEDE
jgi:hypothetical protein